MHAYWSLHTTCCASGHFITEPCLLVAPYHMLCLVTSSPCHAYWSLHMPCLLVLPYCHMPCLLVATYHLAMPTDRGSTSGVACSARILTLELMYVSPCFSSHIQALHYSNSNVHQATKIYRCSIFLLLAGTNDLRFACSTGILKFRIILTFRICVLRLTYCFVAGFAFVYFEDERDAEDAIHDLHDRPFGYSKRRLSVEWSRQGERGGPRHRDGSRAMANIRPTKTLFVINFDPIRTRTRDIERHFEPYGKVLNVRIRRNFAFVQFETQEEATKALECTNMSKILDRVVSVEYALRDDGERGESPRRGGYGRRGDSPSGRSVSPVNRRGRPSPDYGRARSPVYDRYNGPPSYERERSPDYGRYPRSRSPVRRSRT